MAGCSSPDSAPEGRGPGCPAADSPWDDCDPDLDGVANRDEPDADRDGVSDGYEASHAGYDPLHADVCLELLQHPGAARGVSAALRGEFRAAYASVAVANPDGASGLRLHFVGPAPVASIEEFLRLQQGPTTEPCIAVYVGPPDDAAATPAAADLDSGNPSIRVHLGAVGDDVAAEDPGFVERYYHNRTRALLGHELAHFLFGCSDIPADAWAPGDCTHTDPGVVPCDALNQPLGDCWMPGAVLFEAKAKAGSPLLGGRAQIGRASCRERV